MATPVTLADVARAAGVSLATASRAINGSATRTVRPELRERVLAAAAHLRYSPNANAQAMARGRTSTVGLIVHDIDDPYFSAIAAGITDAAARADMLVTLATSGLDPAKELAFVEVLTSQRAQAIILAGSRMSDDAGTVAMRGALREYRERGGGVAVIGQAGLEVDTVVIDNADGAAELARALHGIGYRQAALLTGPSMHLAAADRAAGFTRAFTGAGGQIVTTVSGAFNRDGGYEAMSQLLAQGPPPQLVVAATDRMALGAMSAAREHGLVIGQDVGIAGYGDIATLRDLVPGLSTVRVPTFDVGVLALELALSEPAEQPRQLHVGGTVLLRDSTPGIG